MSANILSPEERRQLTTIPTDITDDELVRFFKALREIGRIPKTAFLLDYFT